MNTDALEALHVITSSIMIGMSIFIIPLSMLVIQQTQNLLRGVTTNERFVSKKKKRDTDSKQ